MTGLILVLIEGKTGTELENFIKCDDHRNHRNCISHLKIRVALVELQDGMNGRNI